MAEAGLELVKTVDDANLVIMTGLDVDVIKIDFETRIEGVIIAEEIVPRFSALTNVLANVNRFLLRGPIRRDFVDVPDAGNLLL